MYGTGMGKPGFAVCKPFDGNAATAGNGNMASIACDSRAKVDAFHAKAMVRLEGVRRLRVQGRRSMLPVSLDGEVAQAKTPLEYSIRHKALRVIVP